MAYAQLTYRESLRDIETCLRSHRPKLDHAGFRGRIARRTLADANHAADRKGTFWFPLAKRLRGDLSGSIPGTDQERRQ